MSGLCGLGELPLVNRITSVEGNTPPTGSRAERGVASGSALKNLRA
jgi:hypothetical protein